MMNMGATQPLQIPHQEIVMVAERAVQQLIDDLRGELGVKFAEIESSINANKSDAEEAVSDLAAAMTDAFKQNNATLRNELKANGGDITQELKQQMNTLNKTINDNLANILGGKEKETQSKIDELEKNINISPSNIKENGLGNGSKHRESGESGDWSHEKGGKYGFNKDKSNPGTAGRMPVLLDSRTSG